MNLERVALGDRQDELQADDLEAVASILGSKAA